jgi:hypothetical protein
LARNEELSELPEIEPFQMVLMQVVDGVIEVEAVDIEGRTICHRALYKQKPAGRNPREADGKPPALMAVI